MRLVIISPVVEAGTYQDPIKHFGWSKRRRPSVLLAVPLATDSLSIRQEL